MAFVSSRRLADSNKQLLARLSIFPSSTSNFGTAHTSLDSFISDIVVKFVSNADGSFDIWPPLLSTACTSALVP